jgi:hypothetical protein
MSQDALFIPNASGASVRSGMNNALVRLATRASGTGRPADIQVYEEWIETDNPGGGLSSLWQWDGTVDVLRGVISTITHTFTPYVPTQITGTNDTSAANTQFVQTALGTISVFRTGDMKPTYNNTVEPGWIIHNDGTIGGPGSGASNRAQTDTLALFSLLWSFGDAVSPLSGTRGATAAADFAANKNIRLPPLAGRAIGAAGQGVGLTLRTLGSAAGSESASHLLSTAEQTTYAIGPSGLGGVGGGSLGKDGFNVDLICHSFTMKLA